MVFKKRAKKIEYLELRERDREICEMWPMENLPV
jgi:hypothetical protein